MKDPLPMKDPLRKGYVPSPFGQLHYVECGTGEPVLLLHQTPRSWTEYLDVLPLVGAEHRAIAMDTLGFGASAKPEGPHSVERFADAAGALIEELKLERFHLVGHHTGGVIAVELAARHQDRVASLLLSATPFIDDEKRRTAGERKPVDHVVPQPDGSHLVELWNRRRAFYQDGEEAALNRFMVDALTVLDRVEEGHEAVRFPDGPAAGPRHRPHARGLRGRGPLLHARTAEVRRDARLRDARPVRRSCPRPRATASGVLEGRPGMGDARLIRDGAGDVSPAPPCAGQHSGRLPWGNPRARPPPEG
ncbi:alpha/beta fold hydrolase, partial [Streptomyces avermitilis]|uniref:alpha/beta fold hydrolase n=1 Tax=Streptomyces avermitilis TaxID=33903 RepID=UPI0033B5C830